MVVVSPSRRRARSRRQTQGSSTVGVTVVRSALYAACLFLLAISFISLELQTTSQTTTSTTGVDDLILHPPRSLRRSVHDAVDEEEPNEATGPPTRVSPTMIELEAFEGTENQDPAQPQDLPLNNSARQWHAVSNRANGTEHGINKSRIVHDAISNQRDPTAVAKNRTTPPLDAATRASSTSTHKKPLSTPVPVHQPNTTTRTSTLVATNAAHASVLHALHTTVHADAVLVPTVAPTVHRVPALPRGPPPSTEFSHITQAPVQSTPAPVVQLATAVLQQNTTVNDIGVKVTPTAPPPQKPSLFVIVADSRSASDWVLSRLDGHPAVCSATELGGFGSGFPLGIMLPDGMPWLPVSDIRQGCTLRFIRDHVLELLENTTSGKSHQLPQQCRDDTSVSADDELRVHYPRLCRFAQKMLDEGVYDPSHRDATAAAITHMYLQAYESNDGDLLACQCPTSTTQVRGFKAMSDWIPRIPGFLDETYPGLKVIRLRRRNVVARFMSLTAAVHTDMWQTHTATEKERQLQILQEKNITIDPDEMMRQIRFMHSADEEADRWTLEHVEHPVDDVLSIEYEDCRDDSLTCFSSIFEFIGVSDPRSFVSSRTVDFTSTFSGSKAASVSALLEHVRNKPLIETVLAGKQLGRFVGVAEATNKLLHLQIISSPQKRVTKPMGDSIETITAFLGETRHKPKFGDAMDKLAAMPLEADVILSVSPEGAGALDVHHQVRSIGQYYSSYSSFRDGLNDVADAVIVSATSVCCAAALSHLSPGDLIFTNGTVLERKHRACTSGSPGCLWDSDTRGLVWRQRFESLATQQSKDSQHHPIYLDGSLMVGKVKHVLHLLKDLQVDGSEDDRAVLADYMLQNPTAVVLDYDERFFGRQIPHSKLPMLQSCSSDWQQLRDATSPSDGTVQLFSHSPRSLGCQSTTSKKSDAFPKWGEKGIKIRPIVDHIEELLVKNETLYGMTQQFQPEILYSIGKSGITGTAREPEPYRIAPTEKLYSRAAEMLLAEASDGGENWSNLQNVVNNGGSFPFWAWFGDYKDCNFHNSGKQNDESVPVFTTSATKACDYAFPSPQYASILESKDDPSDWYSMFQQYDNDYPWQSKIRKIVWRGSLAESDPSRVFSSIRWQLCQRVASQSNLADLFDVGLTEISPGLKADIDVSNAGGFKPRIDPVDAFQRFTAILDMDGNSWSSRFDHLLCFNSVVLKVEPEYLDYFHYELRPWKHYIPIKRDLSDLEEVARFVADPSNDVVLRDIAAAANHWCSKHLLLDQLAYDQLYLWDQYVGLLDQDNPRWMGVWEQKRANIVGLPYNLAPLTGTKQ